MTPGPASRLLASSLVDPPKLGYVGHHEIRQRQDRDDQAMDDQDADLHTVLVRLWFRVDLETMRAIDPGLYKNELRQLCHEQERAYGLRQLDNERNLDEERRATRLGMGQQNQLANDMARRHAAERAARAPSQHEMEEAHRLGTDLRGIRDAILDCVQRADSGRALNAALEQHGLVLANGERRDCFVVIDQAGGQHALNKS